MLELARFDGRNRLRGSVYLSIAMAALAALMVWVFPSYSDAFGGDEEILEAMPAVMIRMFDIQTFASLEGFLVFELYVFGWIILLGLYVAYLGAGTVADDVERGRMDVVLSMPVSRARVLLERYAALAVPIVAVNVLTPIVVYVGGELIDEPIPAADVLAVHLLSIPYLFVCGAIGLAASVIADRVGIAQRIAIGATFGLFLIESLLVDTDYERFGAISPTRYYDPNEILLEGTYDLGNVAVLFAMGLVLVVASHLRFKRADI